MAGDNYWQAAGQTCDTFLCDGIKQTVEVTICPLKVIEDGNQTKAVWGCSRWKSCNCLTCSFSSASKGPKK